MMIDILTSPFMFIYLLIVAVAIGLDYAFQRQDKAAEKRARDSVARRTLEKWVDNGGL